MMSAVRLSSVRSMPRSYQNSLYDSTPPSDRGAYPDAPFSGSKRSRFCRLRSDASNTAALVDGCEAYGASIAEAVGTESD